MNREWDEASHDFIPPQNDPQFIEAICEDCHLERTTGRRPGAEKTVSTRGSDLGEAARVRKLTKSEEDFRRRLLAKQDGEETKKPSRWPKQKFPSRRSNNWGSRGRTS